MKEIPILYSTGCPKCSVLIKKLNEKGIEYKECNDIEQMKNLGFDVVPVLFANGVYMGFVEAVDWIKTQGDLA